MKTKRKKYNERDDLEKIESQWTKLSGLHTREEWSAAVVRAATAAEIAANLVVREEFAKRSDFDAAMVDSLLKWANGLDGKVSRLIKPLLAGRGSDLATVTSLFKKMEAVSQKRNRIVHAGEFCGAKEAAPLIASCKKFVEGLVGIYYDGYQLSDAENGQA